MTNKTITKKAQNSGKQYKNYVIMLPHFPAQMTEKKAKRKLIISIIISIF